MESNNEEFYISVDVETAGPTPSQYSLLSIGACLVFEPEKRFYVELQPVNEAFSPEALHVSGLDLAALKTRGVPPREALERFEKWIEENLPAGVQPVFVAFNAPFDWMFVADYFQRYLGRNPFGHKALDIKAYVMGLNHTTWSQTGYERITGHYGVQASLPHHALADAVLQAQLFRSAMTEQKS